MGRKRKKLNFAKISREVNFAKAFEGQEVLYGLVTSHNQAATVNDEEFLIVEVDRKRIHLLKSEVGYLPKRQPISNLVGRILTIVITSYDQETELAFGSHKLACQLLA